MKNEESRCAQNEESLLEAGLCHNASFFILHSSFFIKTRLRTLISYLFEQFRRELRQIHAPVAPDVAAVAIYLNSFGANSVRYTRQLRQMWPPSLS